MDYNAKKIIQILEKKGYEAYIVGGCVRDIKMGRIPKDWDITTSATPDQVKEVFQKLKIINIPTGEKFGTITIVMDGENYEVTTYRIDGEYFDSRRPHMVEFTRNLKLDLSRRDLTINAIAYNEKEGFIDYFGGICDIERKIIKAVGNPEKRFKEDALRMLRAIRFSCTFGFEIEDKTLVAIKIYSETLKNISIERIRIELDKILMSDNPIKGMNYLYDTGLLKYVLPELMEAYEFDQHNNHHSQNVFDHILSVVDNSPKIKRVRIAALFHDIGKPKTFSIDDNGIGHFYKHDIKGYEMSLKILKRLKYDNKTISDVSNLVREHLNRDPKIKKTTVKRLLNRIGENLIFDLFLLQKADFIAKRRGELKDSGIERAEKIAKEILELKEVFTEEGLDITGNDIINIGFKGKQIGEIKRYLLEEVIKDSTLNNKNKLLEIINENFKNLN